MFLSACADGGGVSGVSQAQYDSVVAQNQQLQAHVRRLQSAVKYTVNSDLLFPSGGYELSDAGKDTIAKVAQILAPQQEERLVVNGYTDNAPVGPTLQNQGITSNQNSVGKACPCRDGLYDLARREAGVSQCTGMG